MLRNFIPSLLLIFLFCPGGFAQKKLNIKELLQEEKTVKTPKQKSVAQIDLGIAYFHEGNLKKAQVYFFKALKNAEKIKDKNTIAAIYNNIGSVYNEMEQMDKARYYASLPLKWPEIEKDYELLADLYNTIGLSYYQDYKDSLAIVYFRKSVEYSELTKDKSEIALNTRNFGAFLCEMGNKEGLIYFRKALTLFDQKKDSIFLFSCNVALAEAYNGFKIPDSSKLYLNQAKNYLSAVKNNPHRLLDFYYADFERLELLGMYKEALNSYMKYRDMDRKIINVDSRKELDEIKSKYQTEKKDLKIKTQKKLINQTKTRNNLLLVLVFLLSIVFVLVFYWVRTKNQLKFLKLENENKQLALEKFLEGEENERTRIAKELHDGVVQDLTAIFHNMNLLKKLDGAEKNQKVEEISTYIKNASSDVRNLSHQMMPIALRENGLQVALDELFEKSLLPMAISYSIEVFGIEERLSQKIEISIYRIVQELINNLLKHSNANEVNCVLRKKDKFLTLIFEENGSGFDPNEVKHGIGLNSLKNRIDFLKGEINFESNSEAGLIAYVQIPI
jgi:signal transduction histidine kinase